MFLLAILFEPRGKMTNIKLKRCHVNAKLPKANKDGDIGFDLSCVEEVELAPMSVTKVSTGLQVADIPNTVDGSSILLKIESRSGLALKGVWAIGGIIDINYRGMIDVILFNSNPVPYRFAPNDRIAQLVLYRVLVNSTLSQPAFTEVDEVTETNRGSSGFGSSGA